MTARDGRVEARWQAQAEQARRDLSDLAGQLAAGEIDEDTGRTLHAAYRRELEEAEANLNRPAAPEPAAPGRSKGRLVVGAAVVVACLVVALVSVSGADNDPAAGGALQGVAAGGAFDPASYSNETLEAVIAANLDDPQIAGMRLALAERYLEEGAFSRALPHYQAILDSNPPAPLAATALTRLAWIVWAGNGEADIALGLVDRALAAVPGDAEALYVSGQVLWCGKGDTGAAAERFEQVLAVTGLDAAVADQVRADLAAVRAGEPCG